jgi:signal transduction histidine kinase
MDIALTITTIFHFFLITITLGTGFFVLYRNNNKLADFSFFLLCLATVGYEISYVLGTNTADGHSSQIFFTYGIVILFIPIILLQWAIAIVGKMRSVGLVLIPFYTGIGVLTYYLLSNPMQYLGNSLPKLYFINFYNPGPLHNIVVMSFSAGCLISLLILSLLAHKATPEMKKRLGYVSIGALCGYVFIASPVFLIYDLPFDPFWTLVTGLFIIPLAYSILNYNLMSAHAVARRSLLYGISIAVVGVGISLVNSINAIVVRQLDGFPEWIIPFLSGVIAVSIGFFVLDRIKAVDTLKYEMITILTHKLRTPLTSIRWSVENLRTILTAEPGKQDIDVIATSNTNLIELVNQLTMMSKAEGGAYTYKSTPTDITALLHANVAVHGAQAKKQNITITLNAPMTPTIILADTERLQYVFHILLENAIKYSTPGSTVEITFTKDAKRINYTITDHGIGISTDEMPYLFSKLFRGTRAKAIDTEGVGIDLFMAKEIIERHGGTLRAESEGAGKGSTFRIVLPMQSP